MIDIAGTNDGYFASFTIWHLLDWVAYYICDVRIYGLILDGKSCFGSHKNVSLISSHLHSKRSIIAFWHKIDRHIDTQLLFDLLDATICIEYSDQEKKKERKKKRRQSPPNESIQ